MKQRYFIRFSYDGTNYHGWQYQPNAISVQEVMTTIMQRIFGPEMDLTAAGRTDAGVHARAHVSHANVPFLIPPEKLPLAMNTLLPADVSVLKAVVVTEDFHARFSSMGK